MAKNHRQKPSKIHHKTINHTFTDLTHHGNGTLSVGFVTTMGRGMSYYSIINSQTELYCVFAEYGCVCVCVCTYIHTHPYVHLLRMLLGCVMPWRKCKASYRANHCLHAHRFGAVLLATRLYNQVKRPFIGSDRCLRYVEIRRHR